MYRKINLFVFSSILIFLVSASNATGQGNGPDLPASPLGTAITYQGRLNDQGTPADGAYDLRFILYDAETGGAQVGSTVTVEDVPVSDGYFSLRLDFGAAAFNGQARWLEIAVRPGSSSDAYTLLAPRQTLSPTPYAVYSQTAPWSGLAGMPHGFADGVDDDTLYSAGTGLMLSGTEFSVDSAVVQSRVSGFCAAGYAIRAINEDGSVTCEQDNDTTSFWSLGGNSGTNPASDYLGTSDNQPLVLRVNGVQALRLEPSSGTPNLVGGYNSNNVFPGVQGAVIAGGGDSNGPNTVSDIYGTVSGGWQNQAGNGAGTSDDARFSTVGGGSFNKASGIFSTASGGVGNTASGSYSTAGGGYYNVAGGLFSTASGRTSTASGDYSMIGGGYSNTASGYISTIGGGLNNIASGSESTTSGGQANTASGSASTVPGGLLNQASGNFSFAAGRRAKANSDGTFVWADSNNFDYSSYGNNSFSARATGGFYLVAGINSSGDHTWACYFINGGSWSCSSDRNMKENIQAVDGQAILEKVSRLPLSTWNAKGADPNVKHLGPMAQDFYATFGLGEDDKHINTIDLDGVALAAIQGLHQQLQEKDARISELEAGLTSQQAQLEALEARLGALERGVQHGSTGQGSRSGLLAYLGLSALGVGLAWWGKKGGEK